MNPSDWDWDKAAFHPLVAALLGSAVGAWKAIPGATPGQRMVNGATGFIAAVYGGSALVESTNVQSIKIAALIIIICGLCGVIAIDGLLNYLRLLPISEWPIIGRFVKKPSGDGDA